MVFPWPLTPSMNKRFPSKASIKQMRTLMYNISFQDFLRACNFIKKRLQHRCFHVTFSKFLKTPFWQNTPQWLLLHIAQGFWYSELVLLNKANITELKPLPNIFSKWLSNLLSGSCSSSFLLFLDTSKILLLSNSWLRESFKTELIESLSESSSISGRESPSCKSTKPLVSWKHKR